MKNRKSFKKISVQFLAYLKKIEAQAKSIFLIKKRLFINIKKLSSYCCSHGVRTTPNKNKPSPSHNPPLKSNLSELLQKNFLFPTSSPLLHIREGVVHVMTSYCRDFAVPS